MKVFEIWKFFEREIGTEEKGERGLQREKGPRNGIQKGTSFKLRFGLLYGRGGRKTHHFVSSLYIAQ